MPDERAAYSVQQLADRWGVPVDRVRGLITSGVLRAFPVDPTKRRRTWRIPAAAVEAHEAGAIAAPTKRIRRRRRDAGAVPARY